MDKTIFFLLKELLCIIDIPLTINETEKRITTNSTMQTQWINSKSEECINTDYEPLGLALEPVSKYAVKYLDHEEHYSSLVKTIFTS